MYLSDADYGRIVSFISMKRNFNFLNVKNELFHISHRNWNIFFKRFADNLKYIGFSNLAIAMDLKPSLQEIYVP